MTLGSLDSNGIGRYAEATPIGANFSGYMNEGLAAVSAALTTLLAKRAILGFRAANSTAMGALAGMSAGDMCYRTDNGITYRYNGAAWKRWDSDWIDYTATLTNITIGTGGAATRSTQYKFLSGRVKVRWRLLFGSTGAAYPSSTGPLIGLPGSGDPGGAVTLRAPLLANEVIPTSGGTIFDSGVSVNLGHVRYSGTDTDKFGLLAHAGTAGGTSTITTTNPVTFGAGDGFAGEMEADIA